MKEYTKEQLDKFIGLLEDNEKESFQSVVSFFVAIGFLVLTFWLGFLIKDIFFEDAINKDIIRQEILNELLFEFKDSEPELDNELKFNFNPKIPTV